MSKFIKLTGYNTGCEIGVMPNRITSVYEGIGQGGVKFRVVEMDGKEASNFWVSQTLDEINALCNESTEQPQPHQNIYYRTSDRLPTAEDADKYGCVLVFDDLVGWGGVASLKNVKDYVLWAPVPKVEVIV